MLLRRLTRGLAVEWSRSRLQVVADEDLCASARVPACFYLLPFGPSLAPD